MNPFILLIATLAISTLSQNLPPQNPVIGIFTQTLSNTPTNKSSYIAASYVQWIEMSGAQVVPIYSFSNTSDILTLLGKINGVLFPGN
jgi:gamma-glutamyl-gamma-aminobutyrate hydrolase PuuD